MKPPTDNEVSIPGNLLRGKYSRLIVIKYNIIYRILFLSLCLMWFIACHRNKLPEEVKEIVQSAKNKALSKVLNHYSNAEDSLRFRAACFLIKNMQNKGFNEGAPVRHFDQLFEKAFQLTAMKKKPLNEKEIEHLLDSVMKTKPDSSLNYVKDIDRVSYDFLVNTIDESYTAWQRMPYSKSFPFEMYLQYILPYRAQNEPLEDIREKLGKRYAWVLDSLQDKSDPLEACSKINNELKSWFIYVYELRKCPSTISINNILKGKMGTCTEMANLAVVSMRSVGIPVAIDLVNQWGNKQLGHSWNVVFGKDMKAIPFMGTESNPGHKSFYWDTEIPAKIFRLSYQLQKFPVDDDPDHIPDVFKRDNYIDVTEEYVPVTDVEIALQNIPDQVNSAYICVFDNEKWVPVYCGMIKNNKVVFKKMGRNLVYTTAFYINKEIIINGNPYYLDKNGTIREIICNTKKHQDLIVNRKFPLLPRIDDYIKRMVNGKFQGANKPDFSDAVNLYTIKQKPDDYMQEIQIDSKKHFNYVRYIGPDEGYSDIAEFEVYGITDQKKGITPCKGKITGMGENNLIYNEAFDSNWDSYFYSKNPGKKEWVGMEFALPVQIKKIKFLPRNDNNSIRVGDEYELQYWDEGWKIHEKKIAVNRQLTFKNVPVDGLYWLRNKTRGTEERIFTYKDGKQLWW